MSQLRKMDFLSRGNPPTALDTLVLHLRPHRHLPLPRRLPRHLRPHRHLHKPQQSQQQHMLLYLVMHKVVTCLPFLTQSEQVPIITVAFCMTIQYSAGGTDAMGNWVLVKVQHGLLYW
jgi:hypothetical protein